MRAVRTSLVFAASFALIAADQPTAEKREPAAGEGVVCALAIYSAVAEIGGQCFPENDKDFQTHLRNSVARLDAYVLANSKITQTDLDRFKRSQSLRGQPKAKVCSPEMIAMYQSMAKAGPIEMDNAIDKLVARPGDPTWGTCL